MGLSIRLVLVDHLQEQTHQELQYRTDYLMRVWELLVLKSDVRLLLLWSLYLEHCVDDDMLPVLVNQAVGKVTPHLASFGSALKKKTIIHLEDDGHCHDYRPLNNVMCNIILLSSIPTYQEEDGHSSKELKQFLRKE